MPGDSAKIEQGEATRAKLITAGRELFIELGFNGASAEAIVTRAGVTRGALYHHFTDKTDLFRAVHEGIEAEIMGGIAKTMSVVPGDAFDALQTGALAFLDVCTDPRIARIGLVDAPSVLGWQEWREIDLRYGLGLVVAGLQMGMDTGVFRKQEVLPLAHLLLGAMIEAGMLIANADDPALARAEVEPPLIGLLDGLRA